MACKLQPGKVPNRVQCQEEYSAKIMTNYEIPESMTNLRKIFGGRDATTGKASADPSIVLRNTPPSNNLFMQRTVLIIKMSDF